MEIKNVTLFFVGIILLIVGSLITIFDYPQIQFFESLDESYQMSGDREIHQRLIIEFVIGIVILAGGTTMTGISFLDRFQKVRQ